MVELRYYQEEAVEAIKNELHKYRSTLLVQATGTGKTIVFAHIIKQICQRGKRVLVLAHRDELIQQAYKKLKQNGVDSVIEKAKNHTAGSNSQVTIGSVQSLKPKRLQEFEPDTFDYIIIDEAHHSYSKSYTNILSYFEKAKYLGVTATPFRGDKKDLAKIFDSIAYNYPLDKAIEDKYLCPIRIEMIPLEIDLSDVGIVAGDYKADDLGISLEPYLEEIAKIMEEKCRDKHTVVFLPLVATSEHFTEILRSHGLRAEAISGNSEDREEILERFKNGETNVLCNAMLLTEGWDCPQVDCIINLRPTRSTGLYTQIIGRGTRICENKKNLLVLDFLWQHGDHNLCRPINLVAETQDVRDIANELLLEEQSADLMELAESAEVKHKKNLREEFEQKLAQRLQKNSGRKRRKIDGVEYCAVMGFFDILDYESDQGWKLKPITEGQKYFLEYHNIDLKKIKDRGQATEIISCIKDRQSKDLCSPKQYNTLLANGFYPMNWTKEQASDMIGKLIKNNWKPPAGINPATYDPNKKPKQMEFPW